MSNLLIGEGEIYHARLKHADNKFTYKSFFVLFNVDDESELLALLKRRFKGILSFKNVDYLEGRKGPVGESIRTFARERLNFVPEEIWLHTVPRMFGYAFNPVSFWIFKRDGIAEAALCEVNNTFGERHFYWIQPGSFKLGEWFNSKKMFHVSPFQQVNGSYNFRFQIEPSKISVEINYLDEDGKLALITWIKGSLAQLESASIVRLLCTYGWMTPMVVARIHFQALKLFLKGVKFFTKPEPPKELIT